MVPRVREYNEAVVRDHPWLGKAPASIFGIVHFLSQRDVAEACRMVLCRSAPRRAANVAQLYSEIVQVALRDHGGSGRAAAQGAAHI